MPPFAGRLLPVVTVLGNKDALLVSSLTTMPVAELHHAIVNLAPDRGRILAARDYCSSISRRD